jgi:hypothetical protein
MQASGECKQVLRRLEVIPSNGYKVGVEHRTLGVQ